MSINDHLSHAQRIDLKTRVCDLLAYHFYTQGVNRLNNFQLVNCVSSLADKTIAKRHYNNFTKELFESGLSKDIANLSTILGKSTLERLCITHHNGIEELVNLTTVSSAYVKRHLEWTGKAYGASELPNTYLFDTGVIFELLIRSNDTFGTNCNLDKRSRQESISGHIEDLRQAAKALTETLELCLYHVLRFDTSNNIRGVSREVTNLIDYFLKTLTTVSTTHRKELYFNHDNFDLTFKVFLEKLNEHLLNVRTLGDIGYGVHSVINHGGMHFPKENLTIKGKMARIRLDKNIDNSLSRPLLLTEDLGTTAGKARVINGWLNLINFFLKE